MVFACVLLVSPALMLLELVHTFKEEQIPISTGPCWSQWQNPNPELPSVWSKYHSCLWQDLVTPSSRERSNRCLNYQSSLLHSVSLGGKKDHGAASPPHHFCRCLSSSPGSSLLMTLLPFYLGISSHSFSLHLSFYSVCPLSVLHSLSLHYSSWFFSPFPLFFIFSFLHFPAFCYFRGTR